MVATERPMMPLGAQMMRWTPSAVALILCASSLHAQDVRLVAKEARSALNTASLLRALEDDADPQDYVAAARADYRRLLTALYAEGYYAGTISITVDGVEAANICLLYTSPSPRDQRGSRMPSSA